MKLESGQSKKLREALISAFSDKWKLEIMLFDCLGVRLNRIVSEHNNNYDYLVFQLIDWAEEQSRVKELVLGAITTNYNNSDLQVFFRNNMINLLLADQHEIPIKPELCKKLIGILERIKDIELIKSAGFHALPDLPVLNDYKQQDVEDLENCNFCDIFKIFILLKLLLNDYPKKEGVVAILIFANQLSQITQDIQVQNQLKAWMQEVHQIYPELPVKNSDASQALSHIELNEKEPIENQELNPQPSNSGRKIVFENETKPVPHLQPFAFEVAIIERKQTEWVIQRYRQQALGLREDLGNGVTLEMVSIHGGTFLMGSPDTEKERDSDESPQHRVTVAPFFLGKYPVTQEQWRTVAAFPQVNMALKPDPSHFKGNNLPVENISWHEAVEFCDRLSKKTGYTYRLPSEAEWEYACRAGTTTPFHFGETITPELANYDGNYIYGSGPKGIYRGKTTPVGSFPPNGFGLCDMHGNVWEWCADPWHENYNNAPSDGSVWSSGGDDSDRLLRGGSWNVNPGGCRSAVRGGIESGSRKWTYGFRVVAASSAWTL